jgi:hypothetical protein
MKPEQYRCPKCGLIVPANEVDTVKFVWPHWEEKNTSGHGGIRVAVRPSQMMCHNSSHPQPIVMRREAA